MTADASGDQEIALTQEVHRKSQISDNFENGVRSAGGSRGPGVQIPAARLESTGQEPCLGQRATSLRIEIDRGSAFSERCPCRRDRSASRLST